MLVTFNRATGGSAGSGGAAGEGVGGGVYDLGVFTQLLSFIKFNKASTSDDNLFDGP